MPDKTFLVFGWDLDDLKGGLNDLEDSFDTEEEAIEFANFQEFDQFEIYNREVPTQRHLHYLIFAFLPGEQKGGLNDVTGTFYDPKELKKVKANANPEDVMVYDRFKGEIVDYADQNRMDNN